MTDPTVPNQIRHQLVPTRAAMVLAVRRTQEAIVEIDKLLKEAENDKDGKEAKS